MGRTSGVTAADSCIWNCVPFENTKEAGNSHTLVTV